MWEHWVNERRPVVGVGVHAWEQTLLMDSEKARAVHRVPK